MCGVNNCPTTSQEIERLEAWIDKTRLEIAILKAEHHEQGRTESLLKAMELCEQICWAERYLSQFKQLENRRLVETEAAAAQ